jgi:hypothetical protein
MKDLLSGLSFNGYGLPKREGIHNSRIAFLNPQSSYGVVIELVEQEK